ncbi:SIMPL domain-containing protein [Cryomorpha ignava]|uniref:SIMPL domain-containing protein n=1 Tax=Cryomorpha ignava TaxID=101383 RepID=A0A7K3WUY0_9FLAO|nr:SIMPL domain-containing protein [Cryomorpha ignava]NEN25493.1 SIMPL domain-containing protein [Cryomorpha ignava]
MSLKTITTTALLIFTVLTMSAQNSESVLKVRGEAVLKAVPEILNVTIPIQEKARTYEACTNQLTATFNALHEALVKAGIDEKKIFSNRLSITEDYNYQDRTRILIGYIGSITLSMELEHTEKNLNMLMSTLNDERFNFGYDVSFSLSEKQKDALREAAIKQAVEDAKTKAATLAEALNVRLLEIKEVNFEYSDGGNDILAMQKSMRFEANMSDGGNDIKLNPQEQEIRKSVGVIWRIAK